MSKLQNAVYEDKFVKDAKAKLKKGKDAISFFAKYGNTTPIKYIHCIKTRKERFSPYSLDIVHDEARLAKVKEYFTISFSGILHIFSNNKSRRKVSVMKEKPTEFISLSDWMKESTQFNIISNIDFFKHYLAVKVFRTWRKNVKFRLFKNMRLKLMKEVLYCKPLYAPGLLEAKEHVEKMHNHEMVSFQQWNNKQIDLEEFKTRQKEFRNKTMRDFESILERVVDSAKGTLANIQAKTVNT